jgi:hypothetical protein
MVRFSPGLRVASGGSRRGQVRQLSACSLFISRMTTTSGISASTGQLAMLEFVLPESTNTNAGGESPVNRTGAQ